MSERIRSFPVPTWLRHWTSTLHWASPRPLQQRPNPHAVVAYEDIQIHLAGIEGFEPEASVSSAILTVPDAERLRDQFASGLREHFGKIPDSGIPRLLRLRRKAGAATGFSVVDTGGNWLRVYREGEPEETPEMSRSGLGRVIDVAARQSDARGGDDIALGKLTAGLQRHADAPVDELVEAYAFRADLLVRLGRREEAATDLARAESLVDEQIVDPEMARVLTELRDSVVNRKGSGGDPQEG